MRSIIDLIKQLEKISGNNDKIQLIKDNDNPLLRKVMLYVYDTDKNYGIKKTTINKMKFERQLESKWDNLFDMLDELAEKDINKSLTIEVEKFLSGLDEEARDLYIRILLKDLRINVGLKNILKALPNLVVVHQVMLASKFEGKLKKEMSMSLKLDGIRLSALVDGGVIFKTRQGKTVEGLNQIKQALVDLGLDHGFFIDGEIIRINHDNLKSDDNFRLTTTIVNSIDDNKEGLEFVVFDMTPIEDYYRGKCDLTYEQRLELMEDIIGEGNEFIRLVPKFGITKDVDTVYAKLDEVVDEGLEGLMLNTLDGKYEFGKRPKSLLKVKKFMTCDIRCIGVEEGEGKYEGMLGKIICNYKGFNLGVGSGFTDEQRAYYWEHQDEIVGKIVEVKYFEESKDKEGNLSLRFPVFKWVRDKDEESYN